MINVMPQNQPQQVAPPRARYMYHLSSSRLTFGQYYHLLDVDVVDKSSADSEYRRQKLPGYDHQRSIISQGFQAQPMQNTQAAQTTPVILRNATSQTASQALSEAQIERALSSSQLDAFLQGVFPLISSELAKNRVLDLFKDELQVVNEEEEDERENQPTSSGHQDASTHTSTVFSSHAMSLFHSFHHLTLSKHHTVQHVEWHPNRACVAFSLTPSWSFDQWAEHSGEVSLSYIMLYDLGSLLHPYCIVRVPGLVTTFKFHPHQPAYIAAGLQTGQCILYQISNQRKQHKHALLNSGTEHTVNTSKPGSAIVSGAARSSSSFLSSLTFNSPDKASSSLLPSPLYALLSNLDRSHGRPVTEIHWLPVNQQLNRKGELLSTSTRPISGHHHHNVNAAHHPPAVTPTISSQFVSLASDGRLLYWDLLHLNEPTTSLAQANQHTVSSFSHTGSLDDGLFFNSHQHEQRDGKWSPIFALPLSVDGNSSSGALNAERNDETGDKSSTRSHDAEAAILSANSHIKVSTSFPVSTGITARKLATGPPSAWASFTALTEDGEMLEIESAQRPAGTGRRCRVHASVGNSLERSALVPGLFLSCGETTWALWDRGHDFPVFISPPTAVGTYSCARFSPTRPAVIGVARSDGVIEIWDCLDASHAPAYQFAIGTADRVTDLAFQSTNQASTVGASLPFLSAYSSARQYLAAGDSSGKCHIVEMPRPLRRKVANEESHMSGFIARETARSRYAQARDAIKRTGKSPHTPYQEQSLRFETKGVVSSATDAEAEAAYQLLCKEMSSNNV